MRAAARKVVVICVARSGVIDSFLSERMRVRELKDCGSRERRRAGGGMFVGLWASIGIAELVAGVLDGAC